MSPLKTTASCPPYSPRHPHPSLATRACGRRHPSRSGDPRRRRTHAARSLAYAPSLSIPGDDLVSHASGWWLRFRAITVRGRSSTPRCFSLALGGVCAAAWVRWSLMCSRLLAYSTPEATPGATTATGELPPRPDQAV
jgi:hypothetical protein